MSDEEWFYMGVAFFWFLLLGFDQIMKRQEIIETESGKLLVYADDGFVLYGSLFKGDGQGGLIGSGKVSDVGFAYTNEEFLDALCLPISVFKTYLENKKWKQHTA